MKKRIMLLQSKNQGDNPHRQILRNNMMLAFKP